MPHSNNDGGSVKKNLWVPADNDSSIVIHPEQGGVTTTMSTVQS